jgi:predicted GNAT family N-acyltransferase
VNSSNFNVRIVDWYSNDADHIRDIRLEVFVDEQKIPLEKEFDDIDERCCHVVAYDQDGEPVGTGRMFLDKEDPGTAHIGRVAVFSNSRGKGCGSAIMEKMINDARKSGVFRIALSSPQHSVPFYKKFGFQTIGEIYTKIGIPCMDMELINED